MPYDEDPINLEEVARFKNLDEQIEQRLYQRPLPPDRGEVLDQEMLHDLYNYYEPDAQQFQHALNRVRDRLGGRGVAPLHPQSQRRTGPIHWPRFRQERQDLMPRLFHTGQRWTARTMTLVAAALLIVLVGGLTLGLLLVHQAGIGKPGIQQNPATRTVTSTPHLEAYHEYPLPPIPASACSGQFTACGPYRITSGPDGNLWFTEEHQNYLGRITPAGTIQEFTLPTTCVNCTLTAITSGPDGNLWYTESNPSLVGRITPTGSFQEFTLPCGSNCTPQDITSGPDGNLWFTEQAANAIGRITPAGVVSEFALPTTCGAGGCAPDAITRGPDGNLWFTESNGNRIGRITPAGTIQEFALPTTCGSTTCDPLDITSGPDGNLWFTEYNRNRIGRITPEGQIQEFAATACSADCPLAITSGPDGSVWFAAALGNTIGRITPAGQIQEFDLPNTCDINCQLTDMTSGPDGHLWFTDPALNAIEEITP